MTSLRIRHAVTPRIRRELGTEKRNWEGRRICKSSRGCGGAVELMGLAGCDGTRYLFKGELRSKDGEPSLDVAYIGRI